MENIENDGNIAWLFALDSENRVEEDTNCSINAVIELFRSPIYTQTKILHKHVSMHNVMGHAWNQMLL